MEGDVYLLPFTIEDLGLFRGITDFPKKGSLACVCSPHDENSKALELISNLLS
jgi:hypothetical protein